VDVHNKEALSHGVYYAESCNDALKPLLVVVTSEKRTSFLSIFLCLLYSALRDAFELKNCGVT